MKKIVKNISNKLTFSDYKLFFENSKNEGVVLIFATILSLILANFVFGESYARFWHIKILNLPLELWVNDALMAIFFLYVGLELEREIFIGELSNFKKALLPILAACGGMIFPALIHFIFNYGTNSQSGLGIPMATDIAFTLGVLTLLGKRVPFALKVFLTALAIADDLGAILVIAIFYTNTFSFFYFSIAICIFSILFIMGKKGINNLWPYIFGGCFMWYFMLNSGIHATITGVLLAFAIPFGKEIKLSTQLEHFLHKPVAFIILPIFALANTGIIIQDNWRESLFHTNSLGIFLGLVVGKPIGILFFSFFAISINVCDLPKNVNWLHMIGAGLLAGIGFTMSIFISLLAFDNNELKSFSQIVVLLSSLTATLLGIFWFRIFIKPDDNIVEEEV